MTVKNYLPNYSGYEVCKKDGSRGMFVGENDVTTDLQQELL